MTPTNPYPGDCPPPFLSVVKILSTGRIVIIRFFKKQEQYAASFEYKDNAKPITQEEMQEAEQLAVRAVDRETGEGMGVAGSKLYPNAREGRKDLERYLNGVPVEWDEHGPKK